ncbi:MAG: glycosyl transferase, group 1 [Schlesneria sp.]|nr:glycosyl transferase, group 1 [Schlesneria sp.]
MTRVLHIFGRLNRGGAELRTLDVMRRLGSGQPQMEFVALSGLPGDLDDEVRSLGGEVHYCALDLGFPWRFARLLRERQIDVVHSHVHHFSGYILRCAAKVGVPIRIAHFRSCHSGNSATLRRRLQERLMRHWIDRWATLILGNGSSSLEFGWKADWGTDHRCAVIHNGLDTTRFRIAADPAGVRQEFGLPTECPLVIHVGRMDPPKNHERLVSIWASLAKIRPDMQFVSVGRIEPAMLSELQSQMRTTALNNRVVWAGIREDIPRLLLAANLMYFPSRWEGLPGAVLEASAAGVPVIGSDIPPIREISSRVSTVKTISLQSDNSLWAAQGVAAIHQCHDRSLARNVIENSVYGIDLCVKAHNAAWQGHDGRGIRAHYCDRQPLVSAPK